MNQTLTQKQLSTELERLYVLALSAIIFFSVIGQIVIQFSISKQQSDATVINLAGRQRMLSQRLCKTCILLANPQIFQPDAELYLNDLREIVALWKSVHYGLKQGHLDSATAVQNSPKIDSMFRLIHPSFVIMAENAEIIVKEIETPSENKNAIVNHSLKLILQHERAFLKQMDKIVFQYDLEAKLRIEKLKDIEFILFCLTFIILICEGLLIFKPTYKQINQTINAITESEVRLQMLNEQLNASNLSLLQAKEDLVHAAEEQYRLQIQKDKIRSASLIEGQEEERKRLSLELHDGIGQMLTALKLVTEKFNPEAFQLENEKRDFLYFKELLLDTISEVRTISFNLMPSVLNDFGIVSAIRILLEQAEKNTTLKVTFNYQVFAERLPKNIEVTIYRIVQETLNNTIKYANASTLVIHLYEANQTSVLSVVDDGKGFDLRKLKNKKLKSGINNMKTRADIHNGEFKISSQSGKGTKILVKLPLGISSH